MPGGTDGNAAASSVDSRSLSAGRGYTPVSGRSLMDRWVLSELHRTARSVAGALDRFDVLDGARALFDCVDALSNWYVRRSRRRFWDGDAAAFATLHECLVTVAKLLAPFTPFVADELYERIARRAA